MITRLATEAVRDAWDWVTVIGTLIAAVAAITALLAFLAWLLERRRRPEVFMLWQYLDASGSPESEWGIYDVLVLNPGTTRNIRIAMRNNGDALADGLLANLVAPSCVVLRRLEDHNEHATPSTNETAGEPPEFRVTYFAHTTSVAPGDWMSLDYTLEVPANAAPSQGRLLFVISQPRLNMRGSRWIGSLLFDDALTLPAGAGERWPPDEIRRQFRIVRAHPGGFVRCVPGARSDVRDIWIA